MSDSGSKDPYDPYDPNRPSEPTEPQWGSQPASDQPSSDQPSSDQPSSDQPSSSGWSGGQLGSWGQQQGGQQPEGQPQYGQPGQPQYGQPAPPYAGGQFGGQPQYGQPQYGGQYGSPPPNHLVWAILSTLFCCLPLGIVSIVYAAQVNGKYAAGDVAGAHESSRKAKQFAIWSAVIGVVVAALYIVAVIAMASSSSS
jgi:hypothetical protein